MAAALACLWAGQLHAADAQDPSNIRVSGSNTARVEHYVNNGDKTLSPYQFEDTHWYNELSLDAVRRPSPYSTQRGQISGLYNHSDYRTDYRDFVVERWSLSQEKGDTLLPYRLALGDFFSNVSYRTQSRSLKGAQLELQPQTSLLGGDHSLLLFGGTAHPAWRRFTASHDYSLGASYLVANTAAGSFAANYIFNSRLLQGGAATSHRDQNVLGLAWDKRLELGEHKITLEGELARLIGDHDVTSMDNQGRDRDDNGYFAQVRGQTGTPLTYRLRFERYGKDFRPYGANVSADRQSYEAHAGWKFDSGLQLRGRLQRYEDGFDAGSETDTMVAGFNASGPYLPSHIEGLTGNFDTFVRNTENDPDTVKTRTFASRLDLSKSLGKTWNLRSGLFYQQVDNRTPGGRTARTYQATLAVDRPFELGEFKGSLSPGILLRVLEGSDTDATDVGPQMACSIARGPHAFELDASYLDQHRRIENTDDSETYNLSTSYSYRRGAHTVGIGFEFRGLNPEHAGRGEAYKGYIFWTMDFSFSIPTRRRRAEALAVTSVRVARAEALDLSLLGSLPPGRPLHTTMQELDRLGIQGPSHRPGCVVYEVKLMADLDERQRLALVHDEKQIVNRIALIVDFGDVGSADTVEQTFAEVRSALFKTFGQPVSFVEEGDFGPALVLDVNTGAFIRVYEWATPTGILRFGIPRRLDGQVRMEIQHARQFPSGPRARWGVRDVR